MGLILSLIVLFIATVVMAWSLRGKQVTAPVVVVCFALAGGVGITGYWVDNYTTCQSRQEGREDLRSAFKGLYDTLDVAFPDPVAQELIDNLRSDLDHLLPVIECKSGLP